VNLLPLVIDSYPLRRLVVVFEASAGRFDVVREVRSISLRLRHVVLVRFWRKKAKGRRGRREGKEKREGEEGESGRSWILRRI
jgi:hypothetical protein